jgi:hypothetical protein
MTLRAASVRSLPFSSMELTAQEDVDAETNSLMVYITTIPPSGKLGFGDAGLASIAPARLYHPHDLSRSSR